ncbi:hypothetical protein B0J12DRAFT_698621 [Macrophomina phaseolina]|uniref:Chromo domain-containing protein n=1 Tax=Macrophomina phaseolina TaxID=35725 RepID=A0ABQ8GEQ9_9PEZI|nr:hypothetical protein B0J12DRAFT_698621 [Macrophomina phaseolina]
MRKSWPATWEPKAFTSAALVANWLADKEWPALCILDEKDRRYLVQWEGDGYADSWELKDYVGVGLVQAWEKERGRRNGRRERGILLIYLSYADFVWSNARIANKFVSLPDDVRNDEGIASDTKAAGGNTGQQQARGRPGTQQG